MQWISPLHTTLQQTANYLRRSTCRHPRLAHISGGMATCPDCHQPCLVTWVRARCSDCNHPRALCYAGWGAVMPIQPHCPKCQHPHWHPEHRHHCNYFTSQGALRQVHVIQPNTAIPKWLLEALAPITPQAWVT